MQVAYRFVVATCPQAALILGNVLAACMPYGYALTGLCHSIAALAADMWFDKKEGDHQIERILPVAAFDPKADKAAYKVRGEHG